MTVLACDGVAQLAHALYPVMMNRGHGEVMEEMVVVNAQDAGPLSGAHLALGKRPRFHPSLKTPSTCKSCSY